MYFSHKIYSIWSFLFSFDDTWVYMDEPILCKVKSWFELDWFELDRILCTHPSLGTECLFRKKKKKKRYLYLSLKPGVTGVLTLVRRVGLGDSCWTDKTESMKLVYEVWQPGAISSNDNNDTTNLFSSRKRMGNGEMQNSGGFFVVVFFFLNLCIWAGQMAVWANKVTFAQMKLGTIKKITFIPFTLTWKLIYFGLDILH